MLSRVVLVAIIRISFILAIGLISIDAKAQTELGKKISLDFQDLTLKKALKSIEQIAELKFSYSKKLIKVDEKITYACTDEQLSIVLKEILIPLGIDFQLVDNYIVLIPSKSTKVTPTQPQNTIAKRDFTISGVISEASSAELLIGATIRIDGLGKGTISNSYGFYSLTLPEGKYNLVISYIGYQEIRRSIHLNRNLEINGFLEQDTELLPELLITSDQSLDLLESIQMGYTEIKPAEVAQMPALMGEKDVIRSLQTIPGIKMFADGSTMFHVRGGNRDQNLILLDDAPLYNPVHVLGLFSTITAEATKDIKLYKGDLPVQQGGRLSSLIDIKTNDGNMKRFGFSGSVGMLSSKLALEGPLKKDKSSFFVGARVSNFNWFTRSVAQADAKVGFYDLNAKFNIRLNKNNRLFFTFYSGYDKFEDVGSSGIEWGNFASTLRWNHIFNSKLFMNTTLYSSSYNYYFFTDPQRRASWHSGIANISLKSDLSYYVNPENTFHFGINYRFHHFNPGNYEGSGVRPNVGFVPMRNVNEISFYGGNERQFYEKLSIKYGLRFNIWQNIGPTTEIAYNDNYQPIEAREIENGEIYNTYFELVPRLALAYNLSGTLSSKIFYNRSIQNIHLISNSISPFTNFEVWLPSSLNIEPQTADQVGVGLFQKWPNKGLTLGGEVYYKWMDNQIDYADHASMILNPLIEGELRFGKGRAYGGELTLKKEAGKLTGLLGYAYSRSFVRIIGVNNNEEFPTYYDRPHEVTFQLNYNPQSRWQIGLNWIYTSGASITTPSGFFSYNQHTVPIYGERGNDRLPDYHRLDISVNYHLGRQDAKFSHYFNFSIYNLYGQKNPVYVNFNKTLNASGEPRVAGDYFPSPGLTPTQTFIYSVIPSVSYTFKL
jgi:hypothetical protein